MKSASILPKRLVNNKRLPLSVTGDSRSKITNPTSSDYSQCIQKLNTNHCFVPLSTATRFPPRNSFSCVFFALLSVRFYFHWLLVSLLMLCKMIRPKQFGWLLQYFTALENVFLKWTVLFLGQQDCGRVSGSERSRIAWPQLRFMWPTKTDEFKNSVINAQMQK